MPARQNEGQPLPQRTKAHGKGKALRGGIGKKPPLSGKKKVYFHHLDPAGIKAGMKQMKHLAAVSMGAAHTSPAAKKAAPPRRARPGTNALKEIRKFQGNSAYGTKLLISKAGMRRVVYGITSEVSSTTTRWQHTAFEALHAAVESYAVDLLGDANLLAIHAKRITIAPNDVQLARKLRGDRA